MNANFKKELKYLYDEINNLDRIAYWLTYSQTKVCDWQDIDTMELLIKGILLKIEGIQIRYHKNNCKECKCHDKQQ